MWLVKNLLFILGVALAASNAAMSGPAKLPASMHNITLPHHFTPEELSSIRARIRLFSWELTMFQSALPMMSDAEKQINYERSAWPIIQALIANEKRLQHSS